ncbi:MAG: hypothetical protein IGS54_26935 [Elainella sp. C42_A2020_010]|nr:hypothetical protein [Elainella sp. C42_A2020_010]
MRTDCSTAFSQQIHHTPKNVKKLDRFTPPPIRSPPPTHPPPTHPPPTHPPPTHPPPTVADPTANIENSNSIRNSSTNQA